MRGLDEDIFQDKQHRKDVHCRSNSLKLAAQYIQHYIADHTEQNTVRDRVRQWHHNDADECWNSLCVVRKLDFLDWLKHKQTHDNQHRRSRCRWD